MLEDKQQRAEVGRTSSEPEKKKFMGSELRGKTLGIAASAASDAKWSSGRVLSPCASSLTILTS